MSSQRYVIIRGQVFRWEEKAPFVSSGKSVHGAIEYDREAEKVKCHECGEWFRKIGIHIKNSHPISSVPNYKSKHGIRRCSSLSTPDLRAQMSSNAKRNSKFIGNYNNRKYLTIKSAAPRGGVGPEYYNEKGYCPVQIPNKIIAKAAELGRTPAGSDFKPGFLSAARARYGSWSKACQAAGLQPNALHGKRYSHELLREALMDFYVLNQRLPRRTEWGNGRLASDVTYRTYFGSIPAAYEVAGLGLVAAQERAA